MGQLPQFFLLASLEVPPCTAGIQQVSGCQYRPERLRPGVNKVNSRVRECLAQLSRSHVPEMYSRKRVGHQSLARAGERDGENVLLRLEAVPILSVRRVPQPDPVIC